MGKWSRREALSGIAVVGGSVLVGCDPTAPVIPPDKVFQMPPCAQDAIIDSLLNETRDALPVLEKWLVEKTPTDALYSAALTVGARSTVVEDDLHTVLVVNAAHLMAKRVPASEQLVPLFYAWHREQVGANSVRNRNRPPLPPFEAAKVPPAAEAESKLREALDAWDAAGAEAAMVSLYAAGGRDAVIGVLTRYGQRNHDWVGHRAIWTAYAIRGLDALGWECAPWVLRSLARTYAANPLKSSIKAYDSNLKRVAEVPETFRNGADDPAAVVPLLDILRVGDATQCVDAVLARLKAGTSRRTIWTALALAAVELSIRYQESSIGVHELDTVNALRNLQGLTPDRDTEALTLLQAAAWRPEFRALVKTAVKLDETIVAITPTTGAVPTLTECFNALSGNRIEATHTLAAFFAGGGTAEAVVSGYAPVVVKYAGPDEHHYKYNLALFEETEAALPEFRKALLLGITLRGPNPLSAQWSRYAASVAIIAKL